MCAPASNVLSVTVCRRSTLSIGSVTFAATICAAPTKKLCFVRREADRVGDPLLADDFATAGRRRSSHRRVCAGTPPQTIESSTANGYAVGQGGLRQRLQTTFLPRPKAPVRARGTREVAIDNFSMATMLIHGYRRLGVLSTLPTLPPKPHVVCSSLSAVSTTFCRLEPNDACGVAVEGAVFKHVERGGDALAQPRVQAHKVATRFDDGCRIAKEHLLNEGGLVFEGFAPFDRRRSKGGFECVPRRRKGRRPRRIWIGSEVMRDDLLDGAQEARVADGKLGRHFGSQRPRRDVCNLAQR